MFPKSIFTSRTFLLALAQSIAGVVVIFATAYPELGWLMQVKSIADVLLRLVTTQPVTLSRS